MSKITAKTWTPRLNKAVVNHSLQRLDVQELCIFAMTQAANGNYTYINNVMNADFKGADQKAQQNYFEAHCDVTLGRDDGKFAFTNNKTKGFKYVAPEKTWWEFKPTALPQEVNVMTVLIAALKKVETGLEKGTLAKGQTTLARKMLSVVKTNPDFVKQRQADALAALKV